MSKKKITLPEWAEFTEAPIAPPAGWKGTEEQWKEMSAFLPDQHMRIAVDGAAAYEQLLAEYAELLDGDELADEFTKPTQYGLEVVAQTIKLDLQIACHTMALALSVGGAPKAKDAPKGRGPLMAAGGLGDGPGRGREARALYKRLRGVFPAFE